MGMVLCAARKLSHRLASEHAFSKVVLCVLPTGKVYADVANTELECASATTLVRLCLCVCDCLMMTSFA